MSSACELPVRESETTEVKNQDAPVTDSKSKTKDAKSDAQVPDSDLSRVSPENSAR